MTKVVRYSNLRAALLACTALCAVVASHPAEALPQNGVVVAGSAKIIDKANKVIVIEKSPTAVIDWSSFNIAAGEKVIFVQASSLDTVVNQVMGSAGTQIMGQLSGKGTVIITNPNGILFGDTAKVKVGAIIATTAQMSPAAINSMMKGGPTSFDIASTSPTASVVNRGSITAAQAGLVGLVAPGVENDGIIQAHLGTVQLAAGNTFTIDLYGDKLIKLAPGDAVLSQVTAADGTTLKALVDNSGTITADGGTITLTASSARTILTNVINMDGIAQARSVGTQSGEIVLDGGTTGTVQVAGALDASGALPGQTGGNISVAGEVVMHTGTMIADGQASGGTVKVTGNTIYNQGTITANSSAGVGGEVTVSSAQFYMDTSNSVASASGATNGGHVAINGGSGGLFASGDHNASGGRGSGGSIDLLAGAITLVGGSVDASGGTGGGAVRIGGDFHGSRTLPAATTTLISPATTIDVSARAQGNGGSAVVWSDTTTVFAGSINAAGAGGGNGGTVEVSSAQGLTYAGTVSAATLLLDPRNITVSSVSGVFPQFQMIDPTPGTGNQFGSQILALSGGNVVVTSPGNSSVASNAGAVYLYNGTTGALISVLSGGQVNDQAGGTTNSITALTNGSYVIQSANWANGSAGGAGAVTWGSGTSGVTGMISAANSLVGTRTGDHVGSNSVTVLANGNFVVTTPNWANGSATSAGAVTWGSGTSGIAGVISASNSLVGTQTGDQVGSQGMVTALANGNYVVSSPHWNSNAGAVTWASGASGGDGVISAANSLVGVQAVVTALTNGNYVVSDPNWANGSAANAGAVTWSSGTTGLTGAVTAANSLVGSSDGDRIGSSITALNNGNYVVRSVFWNNNTGAMTWGSGATGITGVVSAANSLVGTQGFITALTNGNYVVSSINWANGSATNAGAVTWGSGTTGVAGVVSAANSLVGSQTGDQVGSNVTALTNGNYVVQSSNWANGSAVNAGAVTFGAGTVGVTGVVSAANSLVGAHANDYVGANVTALSGGGYVVQSANWANGSATQAGAITWGSGTTGVSGIVSAANSLVGTQTNDRVGSGSIVLLTNGGYLVPSPNWANGSIANTGAVTWGSGTSGVTGVISVANSLVGSQAGDQVGSGGVTALANGNYVVASSNWANGSIANAGAITWGAGATGAVGSVSASNSLVGGAALAGNNIAIAGNSYNGSFVASMPNYGGGRVYVGLPNPALLTFAMGGISDLNIQPSFLTASLNAGTAVTLQANNDIAINSAITANNPTGVGGTLTLQAGRSILINANITTGNGNLTLIADDLLTAGVVDTQRLAGAATITMAPGTTLNAGTGNINVNMLSGAGLTNSSSGNISLYALSAGNIRVQNNGSTAGATTLLGGSVTSGGSQTYTGAVTIAGNDTLSANNANIAFAGTINDLTANTDALIVSTGSGTVSFGGAVGGTNKLGSLSVTGGAISLGGSVTSGGSQTYTGAVTIAGNDTLTTTNSLISLGAATGGGNNLTLSSGTGGVTLNGVNGTSGLTLTTAGTRTLNAGTYNVDSAFAFNFGAVTTNGTLTLAQDSTFGSTTLGGGTVFDSSAANKAVTLGTVTGGGSSLSVYAGAGLVTLAAVSGVSNLGVTSANAITLGGSVTTSGNQTYTVGGALTLPATTVGGNLTASVSGGGISQTGALSVNGTTTLATGYLNDITLDSAGNRFGGAVAVVSGRGVVLGSDAGLTMGAYSLARLSVNGVLIYPVKVTDVAAIANMVANSQVPVIIAAISSGGTPRSGGVTTQTAFATDAKTGGGLWSLSAGLTPANEEPVTTAPTGSVVPNKNHSQK